MPKKKKGQKRGKKFQPQPIVNKGPKRPGKSKPQKGR